MPSSGRNRRGLDDWRQASERQSVTASFLRLSRVLRLVHFLVQNAFRAREISSSFSCTLASIRCYSSIFSRFQVLQKEQPLRIQKTFELTVAAMDYTSSVNELVKRSMRKSNYTSMFISVQLALVPVCHLFDSLQGAARC